MSTSVFKRHKVRANRDRAARIGGTGDFILTLGAERLAERFDEITCTPNTILELGCYHGALKKLVTQYFPKAYYIQTDISLPLLHTNTGTRVVVDEECLPFSSGSFDLIISSLNLHWVNDLPSALLQVQRCLAPNGIFIANIFGPQTLQELRQVMIQTEFSLKGGTSPRVSPFVDTKTAGMLLQCAGFEIPVVDSDNITIFYPSALHLLCDLRAAGQSSAFFTPSPYLGKNFLMNINEIFLQLFPAPEHGITTTFQVLTLTGIQKPQSQQLP